MSSLINKSNHPVEVKKIQVRIWKLRDEIEEAISERIKDSIGGPEDVDIEDLKKFYSRTKPKYLAPGYTPGDDDDDDHGEDGEPVGADGLDSSGNEMDEDAKAMMEALEGAADEDSEEESEEDAEAAAMAAAMLGDQGGAEESDEIDEDEAAALAMLGDQGAPEGSKLIKKPSLKRFAPQIAEDGFVLLSDLHMNQILVFSKGNFTFGQNIAIEFLIPNHFILSAEVMACTTINRNSRIISATKPEFRIQCSLTYFWREERGILRDFLKSVELEIPPPPAKIKRPSEEEDDDDFEDLGF